MRISHLFIKKETNAEMTSVKSLVIQDFHIVGQKVSQPFRSVLLTSKSLIDYWQLQPGKLRENIIIDDIDTSELESGDVIQIGKVMIRITFNCEPCGKVAFIGSIDKLKGKRGVLGEFINNGTILDGDDVQILQKNKYEKIPGEYFDRIAWYLKEKVTDSIWAKDLLWNCGVAPGMIRALPRILEKHNILGKDKVKYKKDVSSDATECT